LGGAALALVAVVSQRQFFCLCSVTLLAPYMGRLPALILGAICVVLMLVSPMATEQQP
jgi:hypothetical protein